MNRLRRFNHCLRLCLVVALVLLAATPVLARTHRLAVVVGNNASQMEELEPLSFADDDAFKYHHFFSYVADEVILLANADHETARLFAVRPQSEPTRKGVLAALDSSVEKADSLAAGGQDVVLYFIYSGHGNYDAEGRGFLHLQDGKLTTRDLFHRLISRSGNFTVVLLLDACNASFLVKSRGGASDRRAAGPTTLNLEDYPNVGLVLSSSSTGEVKEWGRYLSGIFSHQVRSALSGLADLDHDGKITFLELASFAQSANEAVENPALRLTPYIRPPLSQPDMALVDFNEATFKRFVHISATQDTRITLYDDQLVRWADAHLKKGFSARLAMSETTGHYITVNQQEFHIPDGKTGELQLSQLSRIDEEKLASRGTDRYYLEHLFSVPFGPEYAATYLDGPYQAGLAFTRRQPRPWYAHKWAWASVGAGTALLGLSGFSYIQADRARLEAMGTDLAASRADLNATIDTYNTLTVATAVTGSAAIVAGIALFVFDRPTVEKQVEPGVGPGFVLRPALNGAMIEGTF